MCSRITLFCLLQYQAPRPWQSYTIIKNIVKSYKIIVDSESSLAKSNNLNCPQYSHTSISYELQWCDNFLWSHMRCIYRNDFICTSYVVRVDSWGLRGCCVRQLKDPTQFWRDFQQNIGKQANQTCAWMHDRYAVKRAHIWTKDRILVLESRQGRGIHTIEWAYN